MTQRRQSQRHRKRTGKRAYTVKHRIRPEKLAVSQSQLTLMGPKTSQFIGPWSGSGIFSRNKYSNTSEESILLLSKNDLRGQIDYKIKSHGAGSETLDIVLKPGETVSGAYGSLMYMNPNITPKNIKGDSSFGEYSAKITYTNRTEDPLEIGFLPRFVGHTVEAFHIPKGRSLMIRGDAYIAATSGIKEVDNWGVDEELNTRQAASPKTDSILWLCALGGLRTIVVPAGGTYIVNKRILVAHEESIQSKKTIHKGLGRRGLFFGGEGSVVLLQNRSSEPQNVYIQNAITSLNYLKDINI